MRQFLEIKEQHPEGILFFRMGDFYEMFFEDAVIASKALELTLTSRDKGREDAIPMCGVPHHASRSYIGRLTEKGHRVVLVEQTEDPKKAKGLVKREVVRVITPGIVLDGEVLDPKSSRYVALAARDDATGRWGLAYADVSTGEFRATSLADRTELVCELSRAAPHEVLIAASESETKAVRERYRAAAWGQGELDGPTESRALLASELGDAEAKAAAASQPFAMRTAAALLRYARETQPLGGLPFVRLALYDIDSMVVLDPAAVANLELVATLIADERGRRDKGTLLSVIDATKTAPGSRMLRRWLLYPLAKIAPIRRRHDAVEYLVAGSRVRAEVRKALDKVYDLERLAGRVSLGVATPKDMVQLRQTLASVPALTAALASNATNLFDLPELLQFEPKLCAELAAVGADLRKTLASDCPPALKDGGVIADGICPIIDENRQLATGGREALAAIEARERKRTGIGTLKIKVNKVFGYYIEVTRSHLDRVPDDYVRKQTIATAERFVTEELAALETKILSAQEVLAAREAEQFEELRARVAAALPALTRAAERISTTDCCSGLAEVAATREYVRPDVDEDLVLDICDGRHPVVEAMLGEGCFVPNDCRLDPNDEQIRLITGPNMAGKSTYMRQTAQIVLLAQMGSFVPARSARIGLCDRVFTRVGAADNLARGDSTFMVEMREAANIVSGASRRSLVVLDEIGRGTSTYDGVSIAWSVTEYLHDAIGCRTLFATHYHELCELEGQLARLANYSVAVREQDGEVVFLRQLMRGGASRSYGIEVARLAGLPSSVVARAREILIRLESDRGLARDSQLELFAASTPTPENPVLAELRGVDPNQMTPMQALAMVSRWRDSLE